MREASKQRRRNPEEQNILACRKNCKCSMACRKNCKCSGRDKYKNFSTGKKKKKGTFGRESTITEDNWQQKISLKLTVTLH